MRELIDYITLYALRDRNTHNAMKEAIEEFWRRSIMDENVSPKTNALLWWIAVVIQSDVLDTQPRLPVSGMTEGLDFRGKIEALDH